MISKKVKEDTYKFDMMSLINIFKKYGYIFNAEIANYTIIEDSDILKNGLSFFNKNNKDNPHLSYGNMQILHHEQKRKLYEILDMAKEKDKIVFEKDNRVLYMPIDFLYAILINKIDYVLEYIEIVNQIPNSYLELNDNKLYLFMKWIFSMDCSKNTLSSNEKTYLLFNKDGSRLYIFDNVNIDNYKKKVNKESFANIKQLSNYENYTDKLGNQIEFKNY